MAIILDELSNIFITEPNPSIIGPNLTGINIRDGTFVNLTTTNLNVTGPFAIGGVNIQSLTLAAPAISLSQIEIISPLAANMPLALIPKGTGGILVDIPNNAASGGNARGDYSIDLQFTRGGATQVASGLNSFLVATQNCAAAGQYSSAISCTDITLDAASNYSAFYASQTGSSTGSTFSFGIATTGASMTNSQYCVVAAANTPAFMLNSTYSATIACNIGGIVGSNYCANLATNNSACGGDYCINMASNGGFGVGGTYSSMLSSISSLANGTYCTTIASNASTSGGTGSAIIASNNSQFNAGALYSGIISSQTCVINQDYNMVLCSNTSAINASNSLLACGTGSGVGNSQYFCGIGSNINGNFSSNCFIFSDSSAGLLTPPNANSFTVRATGATAMVVYTDAGATTGVTIAAGASAWAAVSDRNVKENIVPLDLSWASKAVMELPVYTYNFIGQPTEQRCIGPMAQDWAQLWRTNKSPKHIDTGDIAGVTLGALKDILNRLAAAEEMLARLTKQ